jgi:hypothetical protein
MCYRSADIPYRAQTLPSKPCRQKPPSCWFTPNCGGALKIIAAIEDPPVIVKILSHLGLPSRWRGLLAIALVFACERHDLSPL